MDKALKKTVRLAKSGFFGMKDPLDATKTITVYLPQDVLDEKIQEAVGIPVKLDHEKNTDKTFGYVASVYSDGVWYNADVLITDENMQGIINSPDNGGFKTSNGYTGKFLRGDFRNDGIDYQAQVTDMLWDELTLTQTPKYHEATILNSEDSCLDSKFINDEMEDAMSKITIGGKEYEAEFVEEAVKNFEEGSAGFISKLLGMFKVQNEDSEEVEAEEETTEEVVETKEEAAEDKATEETEEEVESTDKAETEEESEEAKVKNSEEIKAEKLAGISTEPVSFKFKEKTY